MQIVQHRVNTIQQLKNTPTQYGVEFDIRDKFDEIVLQHDAFKNGEKWIDYLQHYSHKLMIANIKTEGVEQQIIENLENHKVEHFFLLDVSLPMLVKFSNKGFKKMAVRFSEYEPIELALRFAGKVDWLWVDCFSYLPLNIDNIQQLKKYFKICIVSPELQQHDAMLIAEFRQQIQGFEIDAVCTKLPQMWV